MGSAMVPAVDGAKEVVAREAGRRIVAMLQEDLRPDQIITREALENANLNPPQPGDVLAGSSRKGDHIDGDINEDDDEVGSKVLHIIGCAAPPPCGAPKQHVSAFFEQRCLLFRRHRSSPRAPRTPPPPPPQCSALGRINLISCLGWRGRWQSRDRGCYPWPARI